MTANLLAGRYELGPIIGTGGMSDVYATTDTLLGREVAVKMMRANLASDVTFKERFRREAQNAARLNHSAIVQVYDTGETEIGGITVPYIVMERVHGRTLREIVHQDGPLTPPEAAATLLPVCEALQHSHEAGIIHRDVKPANIMITNTGAVKIMDFGIARATGDAASSMTQTQAVIGTAQYLSPEQARGKSADARSDIYALGCVLYETVTAKPPFQGESPFAVAYQHVQDHADPPSTLIPHLSPTEAVNIDAVVLTAMAKNPADRYQSAREFAEDLTLLSRNAVTRAAKSHVVAPPTTDSSPTTVFDAQPAPGSYPATRQTPAPAPAVAPAPAPAPASSGRHAAPASSTKKSPWPLILLSILVVAVVGVGSFFVWDYVQQDSGNSTTVGKKATVPTLTGTSEDSARKQLQELGLNATVKTEANPDIAEGYVIASNPGPGSKLPAGSTVTLTVSTGRELASVPDLKDRTTSVAATLLERVGLKLDTEVEEEASDTIEKGKVISQRPAAGEKAAKGSTVKITVSKGPDTVRVPVITGQSWENAQSNLVAAGFKPQVREVDSDLPKGQVVSCQDEGTDKPKGETIVVEVSNGAMITMPNLQGMNPGQAQQALRAAGWGAPATSLVETPVKSASLVESGLVQGQSPLPGEKLRKDALVNIQVASFDPLGALGGQ